jgi:hypothetical protein
VAASTRQSGLDPERRAGATEVFNLKQRQARPKREAGFARED